MNAPFTPTKPLKLIAIGNSTGVILPKEMLSRMGLAQGDALSVVETPNGFGFRAHSADFEAQMATARDVMRRRRVALRELAK